MSLEIDNDTGRVIAVYFQVRKGKVATVEEFANGKALANYSKGGDLLGVELLGPCKIQVLDKIEKSAPLGVRERAKTFFRASVPRQMVEEMGVAAG